MSKIEWTQQTWNPVVGCSIVSPGCTNCYAMSMAARLEAMNAAAYLRERSGQREGKPPELTPAHYLGTTKRVNGNPVWTGKLALAPEHILTEPLRRRKPTTYFVNSMGDLFHEHCPAEWIDRVFAVMALCPQHTFQVLTKRSDRMRAWLNMATGSVQRIQSALAGDVSPDAAKSIVQTVPHLAGSFGHPSVDASAWPLPNVWLGVSAERQQEADARIPDLLDTPAAVRFVSAEPLLGPIEFEASGWLGDIAMHEAERVGRANEVPVPLNGLPWRVRGLDWVIVGGESGPGARPMHPDWARAIRDQCEAAGVPFFFKQWGEWEVALDRDRDDPDLRRDYQNDFVDAGKSKWLNLEGGRGFNGERFHVMRCVGKRAAGRLLDGTLHDAMPSATATEAV